MSFESIANETPVPATKARLPFIIGLLLALATLVLYLPATGFEFNNYDDSQYVTHNPWVQYGLRRETIAWALHSGYASNWHPLTWMSHMLDWQLYGSNAGGHHLTSILIHAANTVILFGLLRRMTRALWAPAFVAAVFGWHPLRVESVAWVAERKDVLCAFFGLLTLWAWTGYVEKSTGQRQGNGVQKVHRSSSGIHYGLALFCFALGLMSKPMLVSLPLILMVLDFWPFRRVPGLERVSPAPGGRDWGWTRLLLEKLPFVAMAGASCLVTFHFQQASGATSMIREPLGVRLANAAIACAAYLGKIFWPHHLAVIYPYQHHPALFAAAASAALLIGITLLVLACLRRLPVLAAGWFWFLIMLGPVIGIVQVGEQSMADRYTYLPAIGIAIMLAWGLPRLMASIPKSAVGLGLAAVLVLAGCLVTTRRQLPYWHDSAALFSHAIDVTGDNSVAECNLGDALYNRGDSAGAWRHVNEALRIRPDYPQAMNNKALLLSQRGQGAEAVAMLRQVVAEKPQWPDARKNLGQILLDQGRLDEALLEFQRVIELDPADVQALTDLGICLARQGHLDAAVAQYQRALNIVPNAFAENALGGALDAQGHAAEAAQHYLAAIQLKPDFAEAYNNLGALLNSTGQYAEARDRFQAALKLKPGFAEAHFNLGICSLALGDLTNALAEFSADLALETNDSGALLNIGRILAHQGDLAGASNHFAAALKFEPDSVEARTGLAEVFMREGDDAAAAEQYRAALRRDAKSAEAMRSLAWLLATSDNPGIRDPAEAMRLVVAADKIAAPSGISDFDIRAAALASAGRFPEAAAAEQRALDLADASRRADLAKHIQSRLALYQAGQPYVRPAAGVQGK